MTKEKKLHVTVQSTKEEWKEYERRNGGLDHWIV